MDIGFALLLLFGGFALGSVTAERDPSVQTPSSVAEVRGEEAPGLTSIIPLTCSGNKAAVIYRDLTLPYQGQTDRPETPASECAEGCRNE
jgi:hypothetical protein